MFLDYDKTGREVYVIDIETDDLDATIIWIMCWKNVLTGETGECIGQAGIYEWFATHRNAIFVGHNILKFDAPVLNRLAATHITPSSCIDTLVLSTLYSPSLVGGHSLDAWGERLGKPKGKHTDWSKYSEEMRVYCHQDVAITCELFRRLIKTLIKIGFSEKSIQIQHTWTTILERQRKNGFYFNGQRGLELYSTLRARQNELEELIHVAFPPELEEYGHYKRAFKQDGSRSSQYIRHLQDYERVDVLADGSYKVYRRTPFNIGSPKQRVEKLIGLGWDPVEFTDKGTPKPFDKNKLSPSLENFLEDKDVPEVKLIAQWMSVNGRGNMVNTWLNEWDENDHCIHGKLFVADTLRLRHQAPNTANIPAVRSDKQGNVLRGDDGYWTYEARDLWCARPNRVLVGTDAAGLELRMLAHFLNRPAFTDVVVNGDPHQYNADLVGIERPPAKTLIYAIQYGAQDRKVAKMLNLPLHEGAKIRKMFLEILGLKEIMDGAIAEQKSGRVELVDGSQVVCPSPHAALNYKLQGGGARVMAQGSIFLEQSIYRHGLDSLKVGDIHDEWQYDTDPKDAEQHRILSVQAIRDAGEELNLVVPLDGTAKIGLTWAETH